jgi:polyferredoxin
VGAISFDDGSGKKAVREKDAPGSTPAGGSSLHRIRIVIRLAVLLLFLFDCTRLVMLYLFGNGLLGFEWGRPQLSAGLSPLGGLFDLSAFFHTGCIDPALPSSMVIVILGLALSLLLKRSFCGWICPVKTVLDGLGMLGSKVFGGLHPSSRLVQVLRAPKTIFALLVIAVAMFLIPSDAIVGLWSAPYWAASDMAVLLVFLKPGLAVICIAAAVMGASLLLGRNVWCEFLCPLGGIYGLVSLASPLTVRRDNEACVNCGACAAACSEHLPVDSSQGSIRALECTGCLECVDACPRKQALRPVLFGRVVLSPIIVPAAVIVIWVGIWLLALACGVWYGTVSLQWAIQAVASAG